MRILACLLILAGACGDDDASTPDAAALDGALDRDFGPAPTCDAPAPADSSSCAPLATDYAPGADDTWDACVSDDGEYHRVQESISSIARVGAFEAIADLLFDPAAPPTSAPSTLPAVISARICSAMICCRSSLVSAGDSNAVNTRFDLAASPLSRRPIANSIRNGTFRLS